MADRRTGRRVYPDEVEGLMIPLGPLSTLGLLSDARIEPILRALEPRPRQPHQIEEEVETLAHATLMNRLTALHKAGVISRTSLGGMPKVAMCELTEAGRELLTILDAAAAWAARGPRSAADVPVAQKVRALDGGWTSMLIQALAALSLRRSVLSTYVPVSYHQSLNRMDALIAAGIVEEVARRPKLFVVSRSGREGMAVVLQVAMWQHRHDLADPGSSAASHVAGAIAVGLPLVELSPSQTGHVDFVVGDGPRAEAPLTVSVAAVEGRLALRASDGPTAQVGTGGLRARVHGDVPTWDQVLLRGEARRLKVEGDRRYVLAVLASVRQRLLL